MTSSIPTQVTSNVSRPAIPPPPLLPNVLELVYDDEDTDPDLLSYFVEGEQDEQK